MQISRLQALASRERRRGFDHCHSAYLSQAQARLSQLQSQRSQRAQKLSQLQSKKAGMEQRLGKARTALATTRENLLKAEKRKAELEMKLKGKQEEVSSNTTQRNERSRQHAAVSARIERQQTLVRPAPNEQPQTSSTPPLPPPKWLTRVASVRSLRSWAGMRIGFALTLRRPGERSGAYSSGSVR